MAPRTNKVGNARPSHANMEPARPVRTVCGGAADAVSGCHTGACGSPTPTLFKLSFIANLHSDLPIAISERKHDCKGTQGRDRVRLGKAQAQAETACANAACV